MASIDTTIDEAHDQKYPTMIIVPNHPIDPEQAEFLFKLQREDSAHTDDKVKQLLTLSSSLATVILVFARDVRPRWLVVVLLGLLVTTVFLCLSILGVRTFHVPVPEDSSNEELNSRVWARDIMVSYAGNKARHDFRVDRYRAAGRYFRLALLLTPLAAIFTVARPDPVARIEASLRSIEAEITALRLHVDSAISHGLMVRSGDPVIVAPAPGSTWQTFPKKPPAPATKDNP